MGGDRCPMKQRLLTILVFLILGVVTNVGVAWGLAWCQPMLGIPPIVITRNNGCTGEIFEAFGSSIQENWRHPHFPGDKHYAFLYEKGDVRGWGWTRSVLCAHCLIVACGGDPSRHDAEISILETGFPFTAFQGEYHEIFSDAPFFVDAWTTRAHTIPRSSLHCLNWNPPGTKAIPARWNRQTIRWGNPFYRWEFLPLRPLWAGFITNSLLWAFSLWLLLHGRFVFRRYRRIKHGLCPACTYPAGVNPRCTECGTPLPEKSLTAEATKRRVEAGTNKKKPGGG